MDIPPTQKSEAPTIAGTFICVVLGLIFLIWIIFPFPTSELDKDPSLYRFRALMVGFGTVYIFEKLYNLCKAKGWSKWLRWTFQIGMTIGGVLILFLIIVSLYGWFIKN